MQILVQKASTRAGSPHITKESYAMKRKRKKRDFGEFYLWISLIFTALPLIVCKLCANGREIKKDNQKWKPPNCLIYKPFDLVAGPGIEPGTS